MPVRREGWLPLASTSGKPRPKQQSYAVLDGYVLAYHDAEPTVASVPAGVLDLRRVAALKPVDPYNPAGAFELTMQDKGASFRLDFEATVSSETMTKSEAVQKDREAWLALLCAAVPDRSVATNPLGRHRKHALVMQLMEEHGAQPSAHKLGGKAYKKSTSKPSLVAAKSRSKPSLAASSSSSVGGSNLGDKLEAARLKRAQFSPSPSSRRPDDEASASAEAEAEAPAAAAEAEAEAARRRRRRRRRPWRRRRRRPAEAPAPPAAPAAAEEAAPPESDIDADWWFTRDKDGGAVRGPFRAAEMRRKYRAGSVQETTLVRWLPMLESRPSAEMVDEQAAVKFSPLAELMTAEGPPFT